MAKQPWPLAARARNDFADLFESLDDAQRGGTTLAGEWTPRHILGHLVMLAELKMPSFMLNMAKAGFNYDKMADRVARDIAQAGDDALIARLRKNADRPAPVPTFVEMIPVGDVAVHTQDLRRGLGLPGELDPEVLKVALDFVTTHKIGIDLCDIPKRDEIRFTATDIDWSHGSGPEADGPGESILMTLAGRIAGELTGDGAALL